MIRKVALKPLKIALIHCKKSESQRHTFSASQRWMKRIWYMSSRQVLISMISDRNVSRLMPRKKRIAFQPNKRETCSKRRFLTKSTRRKFYRWHRLRDR